MSMILSLLILEIFFSSSWTTRETWKEGDPMSFFFYCSAWLPSSSWKNCNSLLSRGSFSLSVYVTPVCDSYYMIFLLFFVWKSAKGYSLLSSLHSLLSSDVFLALLFTKLLLLWRKIWLSSCWRSEEYCTKNYEDEGSTKYEYWLTLFSFHPILSLRPSKTQTNGAEKRERERKSIHGTLNQGWCLKWRRLKWRKEQNKRASQSSYKVKKQRERLTLVSLLKKL